MSGGGLTVVRYDLAMYALVTGVTSPTVFTCTGLVGQKIGQYIGYYAFILRDAGGAGAAPQGEKQLVTAFVNTTGQITITAGYTVPIAVGDEILLLHRSVASSSNLSGETTVSNTNTQNWQAAETNLVTIGTNGTSYKIHTLLVGIQNTIGNLTIRLYHRINGVERRIFPIPAATTFNSVIDAPGIPVINASFVITEAMRVTVQSDNIADNGQAITYEYKLEAM